MEFKLPLFITSLLAALLLGIVWASYRQVKHNALATAAERLENVSASLITIAGPNRTDRFRSMRQTAVDPSIVAFLQSPTPAAEIAARQTLERSRRNTTYAVAVQLWSLERLPVLETPTPSRERGAGPSEIQKYAVAIPDSGGFSPLFMSDDQVHYWSALPVLDSAERQIGFLAHLRAPAPTSADRLGILGRDLTFNLTSDDARSWISLRMERVPAPEAWPFSGFARYRHADGQMFLGFAEPFVTVPWTLITALPESTVLARPRAFLRRIALVALLLVLIGGVAAWLLSRRVTAPLKRLTAASRAIAAGNYAERVRFDRHDDEMGTLAETFNHMAAHIQAAHDELARQFGEARALTTELVSANAQLRDAMAIAEGSRSEAQKASRAKSDFLATMSHEIRTPINAMIGYTDLLELGIAGPLTEQQRDHLSRIRVSGRHLVGLVDEVLDLAGIESGRLRVEPRIARLEDAVATAIAILRPQAVEKDVQLGLICNCCNGGQRYFGDPRRVEQILVNVVSNAVKFTPAGGNVTVRCGAFPATSGWSHVTVEDTGVGVPREQLERIFEPFVQADSGYTRTHGGVGLGLAISRRLARLMGGDIVVESQSGEGSRFTVRLPLASEDSDVEALPVAAGGD